MRKQALIWTTLVAALLGITSGVLWSKLRAERQLNSELQSRMAQQEAFLPPQTTIEAKTPSPAATPSANGVQLPLVDTARSADGYTQSDMTARARANVWAARLRAAGQILTPAQMQALNAAAVAELRRETDESAALARNATPMDAINQARANYEFVDRQHATNLRILDAVASELTAPQIEGLRTQFESWHAGAIVSARVELERAGM